MGRDIKIHLVAQANLNALREVNTQLAKLAADVGRKNGDLRQATMLATREYYNLGDAADKAKARAVLSAKQIEEAWRRAMTKPTEDTARGFSKITKAASDAAQGIGGTFGKVTQMFLSGGIWGAAAAVIVKAFTWAWDKVKEGAERAAKRAERAFADSVNTLKDGATSIEKAFDQTNTAIDRAISKYTTMANIVKELTKAEIELAKQHAIANGMDAASATAAATDLSAQVDYEAERERLQKVIELEQKRVDAAKDAEAKTAEVVAKATADKAAAEADLQKKRDEYIRKHSQTEGHTYASGMIGGAVITHTVTAEEAAKSRQDAALDFAESEEGKKAADKVKQLKDILAGIKTDEKAVADRADAEVKIAEAQKALEVLDVKREARELSIENEIAAEVAADRKAQAEKDKAEAEKRAEADKKAAEKVAAERARLDAQESVRRERERQAELAARIRDHQKLLAEERQADSKAQAGVAAAESKLQQAWGWYRDKNSMAAQMAEEKADAQARKQFEKDFERLKDRRRDWRTAENLSVDDEAVRRVGLAREEKERAEQYAKETAENTRQLAEKIDQLLQVKG